MIKFTIFCAVVAILAGVACISIRKYYAAFLFLLFSAVLFISLEKERKAEKQEVKVVHVDAFYTRGNALYYHDTIVVVEDGPPLLWLKCREEIVLKKKNGDYYLPVKENL